MITEYFELYRGVPNLKWVGWRGLRCAWADVSAAPGDGEDQALGADDLYGAQDGVPAYVVFLLELLHGRQWAVSPLALGDPRPEDGG
jgi:hypothetical protein